MIATKQCSKCKEVKPVDEFHSDRTNLDGKRFDCIACVSVRRRRYYAEHREAQKQYTRDYRVANPEKCKEGIYAYQRTLPGRYAKLRCEARDRGIELTLTKAELGELISEGICHYCKLPLNSTGTAVDRKDSDGGYNLDNCVPCCKPCNQIKNAHLSYEEMLAVAKLLKEMRANARSKRTENDRSPVIERQLDGPV